MKIKWLKDVQLVIVTHYDEKSDKTFTEDASFKKDEISDIDICEERTEPATVDMQFDDGSMAYVVPRNLFIEYIPPCPNCNGEREKSSVEDRFNCHFCGLMGAK